jgi:hypothetical protein
MSGWQMLCCLPFNVGFADVEISSFNAFSAVQHLLVPSTCNYAALNACLFALLQL